jgi:imidazole glycerol phosphate synthase glutamine amidotransferase subunit
MKKVGILYYGTGNLTSVSKAVFRLGYSPLLICSPLELSKVDCLILPGVGHFGAALSALYSNKIINSLSRAIDDGIPALGICLGFQLLCRSSEEDLSAEGLGYFPAGVTRLTSGSDGRLKVPHIGWNHITSTEGQPRLFSGLSVENQVFYFANSFGVSAENATLIGATYRYDTKYYALIEHGSVFGVQFHPEKSGPQGLQVLKNFLES